MKILNSQVQIFNPRVILPFLELMMRTLFLPDGGFYILDTHTHTALNPTIPLFSC